ncbi:TIM-barrel domain-containing protein [Georgenia sp. SUBG003]|uniref:TIM-barrel domain-containing protein n=1 Tax=Georgenia sp. SUBG003 TaxID=1497974 RepID=UPI003AB7CF73
MCRVTRDAIAEKNRTVRPYIVCRAGHAGIQRYAQTWAGDNSTSWESPQGVRHRLPVHLDREVTEQRDPDAHRHLDSPQHATSAAAPAGRGKATGRTNLSLARSPPSPLAGLAGQGRESLTDFAATTPFSGLCANQDRREQASSDPLRARTRQAGQAPVAVAADARHSHA